MTVELQIKPRDKKKANALRREGVIPATLYGPEIGAQSIQLNAKEFSRVPYEDYNHLIILKGDQDHEALIKNIQRDFLTREVQNIEFYKVKRGHKVTLKITLKFVGDSQAVKMGADFIPIHKEVHVKCLPKNIPNSIEVDISSLKEDGDHISFGDLNVNREEIEILDPDQEIICKAETKKTDHTIEPVAPVAEAVADAATGDAAAAAPAADAAKKD